MTNYSLKSETISKRVDNLFLVSADYHGYYEDDYCYFKYFNADTKQFEKDTWTTAAACPDFGSFCRHDIDDAIEAGIVSKADYEAAKVMEQQAALLEPMEVDRYFKDSTAFVDAMVRTNYHYSRYGSTFEGADRNFMVPCKVTTGRKFKGEGVLVGFRVVTTTDRYGRTHGGTNAVILDKEGNLQESVAYRVEVAQSVIDTMRDLYVKTIKEATSKIEKPFLSLFPYMKEGEELAESAKQREAQAKQDAHLSWLKTKREGLREWVSEKFSDKSSEEQEVITSRIMVKKYGEDYCVAC